MSTRHTFRRAAALALTTLILSTATAWTAATVRADETNGPPTWAHETLTAGDTTAWVETDVPIDGALRVKGRGWVNPSGGASTIAVKLGSDPEGGQYERIGDAVVGDDPTTWARLAPSPAEADLPISANGDFEVTIDLPSGLTSGTYFTVSLLSGRFAEGDERRSLTTRPLPVGGEEYVGTDPANDEVCTPTQATPSVALDAAVFLPGDTIHITGAGWCNSIGGGSRLGVKIDDGTYSRRDSRIHSNRTIWAIIAADPVDGTVDAEITLPDGTARTSSPAMPPGAHTLRFLTGSLKEGDPPRTVQSAPFTVGSYQPNGTPAPLAASALTTASRGGLTAKLNAPGLNVAKLTVTIPGGIAGDWVFLSAYTADGSPRYPWDATWFRLGARGTVTVPVADTVPTGPHRLVAQGGNRGQVGRLLGWAPATLAEAKDLPTGVRATTSSTAPPSTRVVAAAAGPGVAAPAAPTPPGDGLRARPAAPVIDARELVGVPLPGTLVDTLQTIRLPATTPLEDVYVYVFDGSRAIPGGWAGVRNDKTIQVDLVNLPPADYRVTVQTATGQLIGWTEVPLGEAPAAIEVTTPTSAPAAHVGEPSALFNATDGWLLAIGAAFALGTAASTSARQKAVA